MNNFQLLLKNSEGKPSLSFTMVYMVFFISLIWFALSIFEIPHVKAFDVTTASGFLSPLMALYFGRRWTDSKTSSGSTPASPSPSE
jgi:hypothetical protein